MREAPERRAREPLTHESSTHLDHALRQILQMEWGIEQAPQPLAQGSTALTWEVPTVEGPAVVKLSWDDPGHFLAGLRASQAVEAGGVAAGIPLASRSGKLSALVEKGQQSWPVAVLRRVDGTAASLKAMNVRTLGALLARLHVSLSSCEASGAWTVADVIGHMRRGVLASHPLWVRQVVRATTRSVEALFATRRLRHLDECFTGLHLPLVILTHSSITRYPAECALYDPPFGHDAEPKSTWRAFDHFEIPLAGSLAPSS